MTYIKNDWLILCNLKNFLLKIFFKYFKKISYNNKNSKFKLNILANSRYCFVKKSILIII